MSRAWRRIRAVLPIALLAVSACGEVAPAAPGDPLPRPHLSSAAEPVAGAPILPDGGSWAALPPGRFVLVFDRPGGTAALRLDTRNPLGQRIPMLVTRERRDASGRSWLEISLPLAAGDRSGWVRSEDVRLVERAERIVVDLSMRTLVHRRDGRGVNRFRVAVGAPATPTPTGTFYVWARVRQASPAGPYGALALGLSVFSSDFPGKRIAIHGTADRGDLGLAISHGCVRVFNRDMLALRGVPLGTPVIVRP